MGKIYVLPDSLEDTASLLTIKAFSDMVGIEQSTLRYWDSIGLFKPAQRDSENNFRYYRLDQIITVNFIKVLKRLNVPLEKLLEYAVNRSPESMLRLMQQKASELDQEMLSLQETYTTIHTFQSILLQALNVPDFGLVSEQSMDSMRISIGPRTRVDKDKLFYPSFLEYCSYAKQSRINLCTPIGGYWESMGRFLEEPSLPDSFFSIDLHGSNERAAGKYLVGYAQGYYGNKGDAPQRIAAYADEKGIQFNGPVYAVYLVDEISESDPSKYIVQICAAIAAPDS